MKTTKRIAVVEQYAAWQGHYIEYVTSIFNEISVNKDLYVSHLSRDNIRELKFDNIYKSIPLFPVKSYSYTGFLFLFFRILLSLTVTTSLIYRIIIKKYSYDKYFFLEIEPVMLFILLLFLGKGFSSKAVVTIHAANYKRSLNKESYLKGIYKTGSIKVIKYLFKSDMTFLCHSDWHKRQLIDQLNLSETHEKQLKVIEYPTKEILISSDEIQCFNDCETVFLFLGLLGLNKGIYDYLNAAKEFITSCSKNLTNVKFYLIGASSGIPGQDVEEFITRNQLNEKVIFINKYISEEDKRVLYSKCNYAVVPYNREYAGGAGTLKDAIAHGRPVLASNIGQFIDIRNRCDAILLYDADDVSSLVTLFREVTCLTKEQQFILRRSAKTFAESITWDYASEFYRSLI